MYNLRIDCVLSFPHDSTQTKQLVLLVNVCAVYINKAGPKPQLSPGELEMSEFNFLQTFSSSLISTYLLYEFWVVTVIAGIK